MSDCPAALLKITNSTLLQKFVHDCVDELIGTKEASFDSYNSDIEWTLDEFRAAKSGVQKICRQNLIQDNFEIDFPENLRNDVLKCVEIRKSEIFQALVREQLIHRGHNLVDNFDWRLKWVLGDSQLASVRKALLQIDLQCSKLEENRTKKGTVNFELDLEMLDSLIGQLEEANKEINNSKT